MMQINTHYHLQNLRYIKHQADKLLIEKFEFTSIRLVCGGVLIYRKFLEENRLF